MKMIKDEIRRKKICIIRKNNFWCMYDWEDAMLNLLDDIESEKDLHVGLNNIVLSLCLRATDTIRERESFRERIRDLEDRLTLVENCHRKKI